MPTVPVLLVKTSRLKPSSVLTSYRITAFHRTPKFPSLSTAYNHTRNGAVYFQGSTLPTSGWAWHSRSAENKDSPQAGRTLPFLQSWHAYLSCTPKTSRLWPLLSLTAWTWCSSSSRRLWSSVCRPEGLGLPWPHTPCSAASPVPIRACDWCHLPHFTS